MFNADFYPTPKALIKKMLAPYKTEYGGRFGQTYYDFDGKTVLDPSAGKGNILDFIHEHCSTAELYAIEIEPELKATLQGKKYSVIADDFLRFSGSDVLFDLIVMNPPFSNGDAHLLHAWEVLVRGDIICLLNAQTLKNPNSKQKQLLAGIIEQHGSVEYISGAFKDAERKTNVEVALVRLHKESDKDPFDFFKNINKEQDFVIDETVIQNAPARQDVIGNMVIQYQKCKEAYKELMKAQAIFNFYSDPLTQTGNIINWENVKGETSQQEFNQFVKELKRVSWTTVFNKTKMKALMTAKVKENFDEFNQQQGHMDFTAENIENLFTTLILNRGMILDNCLLDVFEKMTSYDPKNKIHFEGWKTNDAYKVNQKVIMPNFIRFEYGNFGLSYYRDYNALDDIDKVMCLISGKKFCDILTLHDALKEKFDRLRDNGRAQGKYLSESDKEFATKYDTFELNRDPKAMNECESEFFTCRFYKKGTLHIWFKDERIWQQFNMLAAKGKNWLPDDNGKVKDPNKPKKPRKQRKRSDKLEII